MTDIERMRAILAEGKPMEFNLNSRELMGHALTCLEEANLILGRTYVREQESAAIMGGLAFVLMYFAMTEQRIEQATAEFNADLHADIDAGIAQLREAGAA